MMRVEDLDTPALVIDLDIMERNLARVADYARAYGLRLRPHTKTHKIPALARKQIDLGAVGITVAKTTEGEVMMAAQPPDLLVAYPVLGEQKVARLMTLARATAVTVSLDSAEAAAQLSSAAQRAGVTVGVLAEADVGLGRVGVPPAEVGELAGAIARMPCLDLKGITFYPGHVKSLDEGGAAALRSLSAVIGGMLRDLAARGIEAAIVSGGSTPALWQSHEVEGMNEIRPGTYIFNDWNTVLSGACKLDDCAVSIVTTVVSAARPGRAMVDGGSKTFSSDRPAIGNDVTFGYVADSPEAVFFRMNEEHGYLNTERGRSFRLGDKVRIIPNHVCVAMNLHTQVYGVRGGVVESVWNVEGRGKLR